ncbi:MAG: dipeptide/oligopeptide/nickel ABC transporter permease/ATP-binding protein [Gordonia sp. (in: high G+C Gram-positive bacteria)]
MSKPRDNTGEVRSWYWHAVSTATGLISLISVAVLVIVAVVVPPIFTDRASRINPSQARLTPSVTHVFGTDDLGRDLLLRVLVGTRDSIMYTAGAVVISTAIGMAFGLTAAVLGHRARQVMFQLSATATAFPAILLAVLIGTLIGRSGFAAMVGLAIAGAPQIARLTMTLATVTGSSDAVTAARTFGVSSSRILFRYILPEIAEPVATLAILNAGSYLVALAALSFVGIGVQPPGWDWGQLMNGALAHIYETPSAVIGPSLAIIVAGVSINVLGETLAQGIDPKQRLISHRRRRIQTSDTRARAINTSAQLPPISDSIAISIDNLRIATAGVERRELVHGISIRINRGERVGIVGESGSGKSLTLSAMAGLLPGGLAAHSQRHTFLGQDLTDYSSDKMDDIFGDHLSMVFQDPMNTLNPALTVGSIMADKLRAHSTLGKSEIRARSITALTAVGIDNAADKLTRHPHELSGGQRQRVMIAIALLGDTEVLLADEPTTALDVSVQAQIAELLLDVSATRNMALVLVSHDLALVSEICDRIIVMYQGHVVEDGSTEHILTTPQHPYTRLLLASAPADPRAHIAEATTALRETVEVSSL